MNNISEANGLKIQWFSCAFKNTYQNNNYPLPISFSNTNYVVVATALKSDGGNVNITLNVKVKSLTGFTCYETYGGGMAVEPLMCIAIGF